MPELPVERFGGLDLETDPQDLKTIGAIDLLNADLDRPGRVRCRDGYTKLNGTTLSSTGYQAVFTAGANIAGDTGTLYAARRSGANILLDQISAGGVTANLGSSAATASAAVTDWATFGTPTESSVYYTVADATTGFTLRKWAQVAGSFTTGTGKPAYIAVLPTSNRLAQGFYYQAADSPSGANGSTSTVFFSDAGAPDTYTASNFVMLQPGDGEDITSMVSWRDLLFVFKQSTVFVFYGTSTDSTGNPVFNYRPVTLPAQVEAMTGNPTSYPVAVAGPDGVYFSTRRGIYRTTGGDAALVSGPVQRLFATDTEQTPRISGSAPVLSWVGDRLIATFTDQNTATRNLVWYAPSNTWLLWDLQAPVFASWPAKTGGLAAASKERFFFAVGNDIFYMDPNTTTDNGTAIAWRYQTGWFDLESPHSKRVGPVTVWGSGAPTVSVFSDYGTSDATASAVTLGVAPATARARHLKTARGRLFSVKLSGAGGDVVNGMSVTLRDQRAS